MNKEYILGFFAVSIFILTLFSLVFIQGISFIAYITASVGMLGYGILMSFQGYFLGEE